MWTHPRPAPGPRRRSRPRRARAAPPAERRRAMRSMRFGVMLRFCAPALRKRMPPGSAWPCRVTPAASALRAAEEGSPLSLTWSPSRGGPAADAVRFQPKSIPEDAASRRATVVCEGGPGPLAGMRGRSTSFLSHAPALARRNRKQPCPACAPVVFDGECWPAALGGPR